MDKLRIRAYNVLFGDAILVSVPDRNPDGSVETRHILIDVGNVLFKSKGGEDHVFKPVMEDILNELDCEPLDLYILTHEHLDHVQGLPYAEEKFYTDSGDELCQKLQTRYAWLTASTEKDYYKDHHEAKKRRLQFREIYKAIDSYMKALKASREPIPDPIEALWANNNPRKTDDCVKYLRSLAEHTCYVHRCFDPQGQHPFHEANLEIWAPEEDTAVYYGKYRPMTMGLGFTTPPKGSRKRPTLTEIIPPPGVDAGAFYNLVNMRRGYIENLLAIDKAANNTSVVFCLEWRGLRLLFTGDAEERSWLTMDGKGALKPVHFLKVSHHGSYNGTPEPELLDKILPIDADDDKPRHALVSTSEGTYHNVPDDDTLNLLRSRCDRLHEIHKEAPPGGYIDIEFKA